MRGNKKTNVIDKYSYARENLDGTINRMINTILDFIQRVSELSPGSIPSY